jgi:type IV pilus assembly protein PilM
VVREQADLLVAEVKATLEFFGDLGHDGAEDTPPLGRLLLTGRGARLRGLPELMQEELGVPVEQLDVFGRVKGRRRVRDAELQASLAACVGLGLEAATR